MLDPLTKAKPWLSIKETSQVLGNYFNKEVKKSDIYNYALQGLLELSFIFNESEKVTALMWNIIGGREEYESYYSLFDKNRNKKTTIEIAIDTIKSFSDNFYIDKNKIKYNSIIELTAKIPTRFAITESSLLLYENLYYKKDIPTRKKCGIRDALWFKDDENFYCLGSYSKEDNRTFFVFNNSLDGLMTDKNQIVCTPAALEEFISSLLPLKKTEESKKSSSKTINTQNKVIAALVLYILKDNQALCDNLITGKDKYTAANTDAFATIIKAKAPCH
ncbi:hypothetical protein [Suttonella indologenes]|uniref:Uncharacterized protein n=1 Tax=Suttonella indologenes TaxID=13276 RepID=A0A380MZF5_9GAMM|nr:hypothetical protein [Suttonella indologenes]SUO96847.1 Uncharacterised protein [Suttonella indologenes]